MAIQQRDLKVLRELAKHVAAIAALPVQQETISLWKAINRLKPVRPMVMIGQIPWHEMDVDGELSVQTEDAFCQEIEKTLRQTLYAWKYLRVDQVVEPVIDISKVIYAKDGYGIKVQEHIAILDPKNDVVGHSYVDQLKTEADLEKIRAPEMVLDERATAEREEKAHEFFDGILGIRMQGMVPWFALWDFIVKLKSPEYLLLDMADRPEFVHRIISRLTEAQIAMLDQLEANGWLGHNQGVIHCSGAFTDELPAPGFDLHRPRAKDLWTAGMAQIFSTVSPAMHQEFECQYAEKWYSRFGLVYYGCCEPLDGKIDIIRKMPHVRKISMSPWVSIEKGAERIGKDFVFSRKPTPAFLAFDAWEPNNVEKDLQDTLEACSRHGCPVEFILKDISTVRYQPQRLWQWAEIARGVVGKQV